MSLLLRLWRPSTRRPVNILYRVAVTTFLLTLLFIITLFLLITGPSILLGLIDSLLLSIHIRKTYLRAGPLYVRNLVSARLEHPSSEPFHVPALRDPTNWWEDLNLSRLNKPSRGLSDTDLRRTALLDRLYLWDYHNLEGHQAWHHWVYLSTQPLFSNATAWDEWDVAFNELIRHHYVSPAANDAGFSYVACPESLLCSEWYARGPALLHLTTDTTVGRNSVGSIKVPVVERYRPVVARFFYFPRSARELNELYHAPGKEGAFPSAFNQMLAYTGSKDAWVTGYPSESMIRGLQAVEFTARDMQAAYPGTYGRLRRYHEWMDQLLRCALAEHPLMRRGPFEGPLKTVPETVHFFALTYANPFFRGVLLEADRRRRRVRALFGYKTNETGRLMYEALEDEVRLVAQRQGGILREGLDEVLQILGLDGAFGKRER